MREIVTLQIGGAGLNIGDQFWSHISYEHGIDFNSGQICSPTYMQMERVNVFFNRTLNAKRFYARTIAVDTDALNEESCKSLLYNPANIINGSQSAANNYAKGYCTDGPLLMEAIMERTRKEVEAVDSLQGFQLVHCIGGGTGSGLATLVMSQLFDEYKDYLISNHVIIPADSVSDTIVEPYNALLSLTGLMENSHLTFILDNQSLRRICLNNLKIPVATYKHMNHIIALTISGITSCLRFPGQLNSGLRKIYVNMVPFPYMHFLASSFAPLNTCRQYAYNRGNVYELVQAMFSSNNLLCETDLKIGKVLTAAGLFRGCMSPKCIEDLMANVRKSNAESFVSYIPNNIKTSICDIAPKGLKKSATFLCNTTSVEKIFQRILDNAECMLRQKAHVHWFYGEGLEEFEFSNSQENLRSLIDNYQEIFAERDDADRNMLENCSDFSNDLP